jgi:hypothetical protein
MNDQRINLISLYFLIVAVGTIILLIYLITCLLLVYGNHKKDASIPDTLYWLFVGVHLAMNIFVIAKPDRFTMIHRVITSTCILLAYGILATILNI